MDTAQSVFWEDLASDLQDPEFLREYVAESIRIATIDRIVSELDAARSLAGLTKAGLARAISSEPATVRRLFSSGHVNPTLGTLAEVAAALGMRVVLEPLDGSDLEQITRPLLEGSTESTRALAARLGELRNDHAARLAASRPLCLLSSGALAAWPSETACRVTVHRGSFKTLFTRPSHYLLP